MFLAAGMAPELTKATFPSKKRCFSPSASLLWGTPAAAFCRIHGKLWASVSLAGPGACSAVPKWSRGVGGAVIHRRTPRLAQAAICQPRSCCTFIKRLPDEGFKKKKGSKGGKAGCGGRRKMRGCWGSLSGPYLGRGRLCSRCAAPAPAARPPPSPAAAARPARRSAARGPRQSLQLPHESAVKPTATFRTPSYPPRIPAPYLAPGRAEGRACRSRCRTPWHSAALSP